MDAAVQRVYVAVRERVWDAVEGDNDEALLDRLTPLERAVYVTRELEEELADGGWYLVFANENAGQIAPAIKGYELLGLTAYADHLRDVLESGYSDASPEDEGDRLDTAFAQLAGAEEARGRAVKAAGLASD